MADIERSFEEWLIAFNPRMAILYSYAKSNLPASPEERHGDIEKSIHHSDEAARLLADAESYLTQATAIAVMKWKRDDSLNADERRAMVKDEVRKIKRLCDGLSVTERSIKDRIYSSLNANKARMI